MVGIMTLDGAIFSLFFILFHTEARISDNFSPFIIILIMFEFSLSAEEKDSRNDNLNEWKIVMNIKVALLKAQVFRSRVRC